MDHSRFELIYCCCTCAEFWVVKQDENYDINMTGFKEKQEGKYDKDGLSISDDESWKPVFMCLN